MGSRTTAGAGRTTPCSWGPYVSYAAGLRNPFGRGPQTRAMAGYRAYCPISSASTQGLHPSDIEPPRFVVTSRRRRNSSAPHRFHVLVYAAVTRAEGHGRSGSPTSAGRRWGLSRWSLPGVAIGLLPGRLLPLGYPLGSWGEDLGGGDDDRDPRGDGSRTALRRGLPRTGGSTVPMGVTGLEPVTSALSRRRSPN
jgi:hypothetical protein